jgi:hypothetical protein
MGRDIKQQPMSTYMATLLKQCPSNCRVSLVSDNANQHEHATVLTQFSIDFGTRNKMWRRKSENEGGKKERRKNESKRRKSETDRGKRENDRCKSENDRRNKSTFPISERRPPAPGRPPRERSSSINMIPGQPVGLKLTRLQESLGQYAKSRRQTRSASSSGPGFSVPEKQPGSPLLGRAA